LEFGNWLFFESKLDKIPIKLLLKSAVEISGSTFVCTAHRVDIFDKTEGYFTFYDSFSAMKFVR